ncbi:LysR family transcriptional regulator [Paraburkholderia madseniana]|uniref:LysR family transcriptional regulator n=1 Tax=Paraburkholderia madseniana TaxID=2599607 RepID=UPI00155905C7|nr:LysR family transcriptional regulator [Paraburkholderia madseniana]NPT68857.1 LysR family transcriptional regulator [Paraburkholderia madseniana]
MIPSLNSIVGRLHAKQLRLLAALGDHGSLLNAAREVSMSQPGASKALREIESIFGVELFVRTNRGLEPNAAGHCVIRYARLFQSDMAHLRDELLGVMRGFGGRVSAGTIMGAVPLLTDAINWLLSEQPQMSVEVLEDASATLLGLLDEGRIDLALCRTSVSRSPELYLSVVVQEETLAVIASTKHRLADAKQLELAGLEGAHWVVYRANMPIRLLLEREFHEAGLRLPVHLVETTSAFTTMSLLQTNPTFVTMLPVAVADFCTNQGWATKLALAVTSRSKPYELVTRQGAPVSPGAQLLINALTRARSTESAKPER